MNELERSDDVFDRLAYISEELKNAPPVGWRSLFENYVDGHARIHVHLGIGRPYGPARDGDLTRAPDLCATYQMPRWLLGDDLEISNIANFRTTWKRIYRENVAQFDGRVDQVKLAMLVDVAEFIKHGEEFTFGGVLPSDIRLQPLDACNECRVDGPEWIRLPVFGFANDGERDLSPVPWNRIGCRTCVSLTQLPDQLIEGRPEVESDIADDRGPDFARGFLGGYGVDDDVARRILVVLPEVWMCVNAVSLVRKGPNETGQLLNVFICPIKFRQRVAHAE